MNNFDYFIKNLELLQMPSTLWAPHIDPESNYFALLHIQISGITTIVDKGIIIKRLNTNEAELTAFINGEQKSFENLDYSIKSMSDLQNVLSKIHNINILSESEAYEDDYFTNVDVKEEIVIDNSFNDKDLLIDDYEKSESYECSQCNSIFFDKDHLTKHQKKHNKSEKTQESYTLCNICGLKLNVSSLREHMSTHTSEKPFKCRVCTRSFSKKYNLRMHEHTHTGKRPYVCQECGKSYTAQSNLRTHMQASHKTIKKYACVTCNMSFIYPRYLKIHLRKHTGEKPFVCTFCDKNFTQKVHLTVHLRTHSGEKPYICQVCKKSFTTSGNLMKHRKIANH